ncbi:hypothetical protein AGMMS50293_10930 [Spirochaetia bacterium]|nr:hypothetical protein AGMMS50293_10930 [Spirochaetia bacterium]
MKKINRYSIWIFGFVPMFLLATAISCSQFFSTSLAPWAARDPASLIPPVTTGNVNELIEMAENDPDMSLEVLKRIKDAAQNADSDKAGDLQAAALKAAANASGIGSALLQQAGNISELMDNADNAIDLIVDVLNSMNNLNAAGDNLVEILPTPGTSEFDAFVAKSSADDLAIAAAVLLAAEAKSVSDSKDYLDSFDGSGTGPQVELAIALAKAADTKGMELSSSLKDILGGLNLVDYS